uniref:B-box zinc finger protein 20-like n=1 Tax=Erigeron canadensis TaxID=72917 RepID=UPI001CB93B61|nr:B-box zinc finger protein 20-like [Erigeron canadensis]
MKINCDVCNKHEASVFCSADDAALCTDCDHRVHDANVLAGKHPRFSLLSPSPKDAPICDICQDKKALLFCQQDRAILCKECDVAIHKVNEHTMNHNRLLLTGVKLSPVALLPTTGNNVVPGRKPKSRDHESVSINKHVLACTPKLDEDDLKPQQTTTLKDPKVKDLGHGYANSSSISEYLIEMLPGWHVEDFLDSPPTFSKVDDQHDPALFWDDCFLPKTTAIWVPQAPPPAAPPPLQPAASPPPPRFHNSYRFEPSSNTGFGNQMTNGSSFVIAPSNKLKNKITNPNAKRKYDDGNCFTVPQMGPPNFTTTLKRSRMLS